MLKVLSSVLRSRLLLIRNNISFLNQINGWDLYLLAYNLEDYKIEQILMIKSSEINEECVIPRKKLGPNAKLGGKAVT